MAERPRGGGVEGQRIEVGFGLLQVAWRAARSASLLATSGPTESSASVTAVITGSAGSAPGSLISPSRITVEVSSTPRNARAPASSQPRVEGSVDVGSQRFGVDRRQATPSHQQLLGRERARGQRPKLSDRGACAGNGDRLTPRGAVDDIATVIAQISDADLGHRRSVSRVIRQIWPVAVVGRACEDEYLIAALPQQPLQPPAGAVAVLVARREAHDDPRRRRPAARAGRGP